jgi:hypothetical protein
MDIYWDTSTIVLDETAPIICETESDVCTVTCEGFIYGVIDDFLDTVITTACIGRADVHAGAFADCFESFEDLDLTGSILSFFFFGHRDKLLGEAIYVDDFLLVEIFDDITDDIEEFSAGDFLITRCHSFREYTQFF